MVDVCAGKEIEAKIFEFALDCCEPGWLDSGSVINFLAVFFLGAQDARDRFP